MSILNRNKGPRKKSTKGFSELNKRTYEASPQGKSQRIARQSQVNNSGQPVNGYSGMPVSGQRQARSNGVRGFGVSQNAGDYSRGGQQRRYAQARKKQQSKKRKKIILGVVIGVLALMLIAGVAVAAFLGNISKNMNEGMSNIGLTPTSLDKPFYMVLMGVDSSDERKANGGTDNDYRSDSIILVRIDPISKKVTLMSLHRDTEIEMGEFGTQKLNAAHSLGGPELVISTVSKLAGVPINHYAEINFDGFKAAVDDLGGVEVEVSMTIDDKMAGGHVSAGLQVLNGEQALILCRARHAFDKFGDGDKYRAANQRLVLSAIAKKCLNSDIGTIAKTVTDLSKYIKTDLAINDIIGLAQIMKDIDIDKDVYSAMEPTKGVYKNGVWYEELDKEKWQKMMKRMDEGLPPNEETIIDDATGTVMSKAGDSLGSSGKFNLTVAIRNGTTKDGVAASASNKLTTVGFRTDVGNANSSDYENTRIVYNNDDHREAAEKIKELLGCGDIIKNDDEYIFNTDLLVVVGNDFNN